MRSSYQNYIHEKLKKMSLMERVNAQSKQIQLIQKINYENSCNLKPDDLSKTFEELLQANLEKVIEFEDKTFKRDDLYSRMANGLAGTGFEAKPEKHRDSQSAFMAAIYGEDALPNSKDEVVTEYSGY